MRHDGRSRSSDVKSSLRKQLKSIRYLDQAAIERVKYSS